MLIGHLIVIPIQCLCEIRVKGKWDQISNCKGVLKTPMADEVLATSLCKSIPKCAMVKEDVMS